MKKLSNEESIPFTELDLETGGKAMVFFVQNI